MLLSFDSADRSGANKPWALTEDPPGEDTPYWQVQLAAFCASPLISARSDSTPRAPSLAAPSHAHLPRIHQPHTHRSPHTTARSEAMEEDAGTAHAPHGSLVPPVRWLAPPARMPLTRRLLSGGRSARRSSARTSVRRASVRTWLSRCGRRAWPTRSELAPVCL